MEKDTGVFLLRGPRFEMEPVYNGTIFNSTVKVQLYGFFSVLISKIIPVAGSAASVLPLVKDSKLW
jgi:hypothetical protein